MNIWGWWDFWWFFLGLFDLALDFDIYDFFLDYLDIWLIFLDGDSTRISFDFSGLHVFCIYRIFDEWFDQAGYWWVLGIWWGLDFFSYLFGIFDNGRGDYLWGFFLCFFVFFLFLFVFGYDLGIFDILDFS